MSLTTFSLDSCQFWGLVTISKQRSCDSLSKGGVFFTFIPSVELNELAKTLLWLRTSLWHFNFWPFEQMTSMSE